MKKIDALMKLPYRIEIIPDMEEGGYVIHCPELPGCLSSGESVEEAYENIMEAKKEWFESAIEEGITIPEPDSLQQYSGQFKLRIPKSLHRALAMHAKQEGISMNQYCLYLLSKQEGIEIK